MLYLECLVDTYEKIISYFSYDESICFCNESQIHDTFLRNWNVHSRVYIHWLGDLTVTTNKIIFSESGSYDYEILDIQTNECVLNVLSFEGTNRIFRLGPIKESTLSLGYLGGTQMSVTSYASEETAFAPREDDWDNCMLLVIIIIIQICQVM